MSYGQEVQSASTSDVMPGPYSQHFSLISNEEDIKTTVQPVSNNMMNPSSSRQNNQKLPLPLLSHKWNQHKYIKHNGKGINKSSKRRNRHKYTKRSEAIRSKSSNKCIVSSKQSESSLIDMSAIKMAHFERRNIISTSSIYPDEDNDKDIYSFLTSIKQVILNELRYQMEEKKKMKWFAVVKAVLSRSTQDDFLIVTPYFHSDTVLELTTNNLTAHIENAFTKIIDNFTIFIECNPDYILEKIVSLELDTATWDMI